MYATTGTRLAVRFFGGVGLHPPKTSITASPHLSGYERRAHGRDLPANARFKKGPSFMVYELRDPIGGNLDRIQIIKGWDGQAAA